MNKFSIRLKELINESGISQMELAKKMNISKNQIHYWKIGKAEPSIDYLILLANYFGVCIDYLVGRQDWY